jgi:hypothetical protein
LQFAKEKRPFNFRFIAISFPLWAKVNFSRKHVYFGIGFILFLAVSTNVWRFWWAHLVLSDGTGGCFIQGELRIGLHPWGYKPSSYLYIILIVFGPLLLLSVLYIGLVFMLIVAMKRRSEIVEMKKGQTTANRHVTVMAMCIICLFFICQTPACLDRFGVLAGIKALQTLEGYSRQVGFLLTVFDSCANFFIYMLTNRRFREHFKMTVDGKLPHAPESETSGRVH